MSARNPLQANLKRFTLLVKWHEDNTHQEQSQFKAAG
jgi:hypothetical protein